MAEKLGQHKCDVLPAMHHLTGSDYTSKVGTKHSGILAKPENFLNNFAQGNIFFF